jgi:hypothetical protein
VAGLLGPTRSLKAPPGSPLPELGEGLGVRVISGTRHLRRLPHGKRSFLRQDDGKTKVAAARGPSFRQDDGKTKDGRDEMKEGFALRQKDPHPSPPRLRRGREPAGPTAPLFVPNSQLLAPNSSFRVPTLQSLVPYFGERQCSGSPAQLPQTVASIGQHLPLHGGTYWQHSPPATIVLLQQLPFRQTSKSRQQVGPQGVSVPTQQLWSVVSLSEEQQKPASRQTSPGLQQY